MPGPLQSALGTQASGLNVQATFASPCTPGSKIIASLGCGGASLLAGYSMSDPTNGTYTKDVGNTGGGGNAGGAINSVANTANTALTVTASFGGATQAGQLVIEEWPSTVGAFDVGAGNGNGSSTTPTSASITTTQANDVIIELCVLPFTNTITVGAGFTHDANAPSGAGQKLNVGYSETNSAGAQTAGFTLAGSGTWQVLVAAYKVSGGGGGGGSGGAQTIRRRRHRLIYAASAGAAPAGFTSGVGFAVAGAGFGAQNGSLIFRSFGIGSVGTREAGIFQSNPSTAGGIYDMQLQDPSVFNPTGAGVIQRPHPYVQNVYAGCHLNNSSTSGWDVDLNITLAAAQMANQTCVYYKFYEKADPNFVANLDPDGSFGGVPDNNYKYMAYNIGSDDYGVDFNYWSFGDSGGTTKVTPIGYSGSLDHLPIKTNAGAGTSYADQNPTPHSAQWPDSATDAGSIPPLGWRANPWYGGARFNGYVCIDGEFCLTTTNTLAGGGYYNEYGYPTYFNGPGLVNQRARSVFYKGRTDPVANSGLRRSFTFGGFCRNYGGSALVPALQTTNFRAQSDHHLAISGPGSSSVARVLVGDNAVFANCNILEYQVVPPGNWGASLITVPAFFKGALQTGTTGYVFVVTEASAAGTAIATGQSGTVN